MIQNTRGIAIRTIPYGDTGIVASIYTERYGLLSFLVHGVRKAKTSFKNSHFQALSTLDLVIYRKENRDLHRIKEIKLSSPGLGIRDNIIKTSISFFIAEVLYKSMKEEDRHEDLFEFIEHSITWLDETPFSVANFHISFMLELSQYLGFYPSNQSIELDLFDLQEGVFRDSKYGRFSHTIEGNCLLALKQFIGKRIYESHEISLDKQTRKEVLNALIWYYRLHLPNWGELRTLEVLESTLN